MSHATKQTALDLTTSVDKEYNEKDLKGAIAPPITDRVAGTVQDWSDDEESRVLRKVDFIVMPLLMLAFFSLQLDRGNAGNALTDGFLKDIGITQNQFNIGQQLLSAGIVLGEIPGNLVLYKLGPKIWIGLQIFIWGLVATFQAFQHGLGAFLATRLLLGLCESAFIPGGLFTLSLWYKRAELSKRFGFYFIGNGIASACSGLFAYAILHMRGIAGRTGWQWLFILEGLFTILVAFIFLAFFPGTPSDPVTLTKLKYFSDREIHILRQRVILDDPWKQTNRKSIGWTEIWATISNWRIWPHLILTIVGLAPSNALWSYAPSIINSFGYQALASNALTSVGQWIAIVLVVFSTYVADKTQRRGFVVLFCTFINWIFMVTFKSLPDSANSRVKYGILTMGTATVTWWHAINGSWLSINARNPGERSITMAMFGMAANCGGLVGAQIFRSDDKPYYHRGWTIIASFASLSLVLVTILIAQYALSNKWKKGLASDKSQFESSDTGKADEESVNLEIETFGKRRKYNY